MDLQADISRYLTLRYSAALALIAILVTASFIALNLSTAKGENIAGIVNISGRQRMLSQEIALLSQLMFYAQNPEDQQGYRDDLAASIDLMALAHEGLTKGSQALRLPEDMSAEVRRMYFEPPHNVDLLVRRYLQVARTLHESPVLLQNDDLLAEITRLSTSQLLASLDGLVRQYQLEGESAIAQIKMIELVIWILTLSFLGLLVLLVFRPMVRKTVAQTDALRKSEQRYRSLVEGSSDIVWRLNRDGILTYINPSVKKLLGYQPEELIGLPLDRTFLDRDSRLKMQQLLQQRLRGDLGLEPLVYELKYLRSDGTSITTEIQSAPILAEDGEIIEEQGISRDVTERKKVEQALLASETRYRDLVDQSSDVVWQMNPQGTITFISPSVKMMSGTDPEEIIGMHFDLFIKASFAKDSREKARRILQDMLAGEPGRKDNVFELTHRHKIGADFIGETRAGHLLGPNGEFVGIQGITRDVTERKQMERELQKMEKLESIGMLAGGIAHDLNNFLTGLVGNIGLAGECEDPVETAQRLQDAEADAMRIGDLTQQLLTFSKGGVPLTRPVELVNLLKQTVNFTLSGSNIQCDWTMPTEPCVVKIDEGQIRQVISNLIINAQQAMLSGGTIRVSAQNIELNKEDGIPLDAGRYVKFSVADGGVGIAQENRTRVFDPFFSTKSTGNGLGLATAYSIIKKHDGLITVDSEVGVGSTFDVYLPASTAVELERKGKPPAGSMTSESRILVMDDQQNIRELVVRALKRIGAEVVTSMDGAEAIEKYQDALRSGQRFDAVILDLTIPGGMGGAEAIKHLQQIDPDVTAIVASGYSDDPIMTDYGNYGFKGVIFKPYRVKTLRVALNAVLNES